jgi:hypothetical protein
MNEKRLGYLRVGENRWIPCYEIELELALDEQERCGFAMTLDEFDERFGTFA